jgi:hypothetical protein
MLIRGYKFDMRIYALVTNMNPLELFIYKEGFARLSTEPYSLNPEDISKTAIHLTNVAVHSKISNANNVHSECLGGTKITLKMLAQKM